MEMPEEKFIPNWNIVTQPVSSSFETILKQSTMSHKNYWNPLYFHEKNPPPQQKKSDLFKDNQNLPAPTQRCANPEKGMLGSVGQE